MDLVALFSFLNLFDCPLCCQAVLTQSCYKLVNKPCEEVDYRSVMLFVQWNKRQSTELNCLSLEYILAVR